MNQNEQGQAAPAPVQQPQKSDAQGRSPEPTFSQDQLNKMIHAAKSEAGRDMAAIRKALDDLQGRYTTLETDHGNLQTEFVDLEGRYRNAESETWRDHPETLRIHEREDKAKQEIAKALQMRKELDTERDSLKQIISEHGLYKLAEVIGSVATEHGVDRQELIEAVGDLGLDTSEKIDAYAKRMAGKSQMREPQAGSSFVPDTGRNVGGGIDTSRMSADDKLKYGFSKYK